jgi:prevent-host-death family protein
MAFMHKVNVHEAKTNLSELLKKVEAGEEVIIARAGKPIARLVPASVVTVKRLLGSARGVAKISEDFNDPLPKEFLEEFYK